MKKMQDCFLIIYVIICCCAMSNYTNMIYNVGIYVVVLAGVMLGCYYISTNLKLLKNTTTWLLLMFLIFNILTLVMNFGDNVAIGGFVLLSTSVYFYVFLSFNRYSKEEIKKLNLKIFSIFVAWTFFLSVISIIVIIIGTGDTEAYKETGEGLGFVLRSETIFMMHGIYKGSSTAAIYSALSALLSIYLMKQYIDNKQKKMIAVMCGNIVLQIFVMFLTSSLTALIVFNITIFLLIQITFQTKITIDNKVIKFITGLLLALIIVTCLNIAFDALRNKTVENLVTPSSLDVVETTNRDIAESLKTGTGRYSIWNEAITQWKEKPFLGIGFGEFEYTADTGEVIYRDTHNGYLAVLVENGILAFLCIILFFSINMIKGILTGINTKDVFLMLSIIIIMFLFGISMAQETFILQRGIVPLLMCILLGQIIRRNEIFLDENHYERKKVKNEVKDNS